MRLRAPYPWFGGKSKVMPVVWQRFGDVRNFVDPFLGSGASVLSRPGWPWTDGVNRIETVNDFDGFVSNFWRALQADPEAVAHHADWPVNECDLHARHLWLVNEGRLHVERLKTEPDYFDAKIAGWWVWGLCQWIGSGWCSHPEWQKRPHLGGGRGVHRPSQQRPHLGNAGSGSDLLAYMQILAERFRRVRVCCGDWSRVLGPTPTFKHGLTGVFLDPPYSHAVRDDDLYACDHDVAADVRAWCIDNGDNPLLRIALCGYAGEGHEELESRGWSVHEWKAQGGYGNQGTESDGRENATKERIWFSPHCVANRTLHRSLFAEDCA